MKIITNNSVVFGYGENIEKGRWENDPYTDTYRIAKENGYEYCVTADFEVYKVDSIPVDYEPNKYCYTVEDGFYANPDYIQPNEYGVDNETYNTIIDDYTLSLMDSGLL